MIFALKYLRKDKGYVYASLRALKCYKNHVYLSLTVSEIFKRENCFVAFWIEEKNKYNSSFYDVNSYIIFHAIYGECFQYYLQMNQIKNVLLEISICCIISKYINLCLYLYLSNDLLWFVFYVWGNTFFFIPSKNIRALFFLWKYKMRSNWSSKFLRFTCTEKKYRKNLSFSTRKMFKVNFTPYLYIYDDIP